MREAELFDWSSADGTTFVDDYVQPPKVQGPFGESWEPRFPLRSIGKRYSVQLAQRLGYVSRCNTNLEWDSLKPWCLAIRGHYASRPIKAEIAYRLNRLAVASGYRPLLDLNDRDQTGADIAIHWRYGDLAAEKPEGVISAERVIDTVFRTLGTDQIGQTFSLYSDSPDQGGRKFRDALPCHFALDVVEDNPWNSLCGLVNSRNFIGSRSKLSIWAAAFRAIFDQPGVTIMPTETEAALHALLPGAQPSMIYY